MKTITIKQPWAFLICSGVKDIENRTWATKVRGRVLVHASVKPIKFKFDIEGQATAKEIQIYSVLNHCEENNLFGAIIGSVEIVDCVVNHPSIWAEHWVTKAWHNGVRGGTCDVQCYNWVLKNPIMFPEPIPAKGKLSFWEYTNILAAPEEENGELFCHCQIPVDEIAQVTGDSRFGYYCRYCGGKWYK